MDAGADLGATKLAESGDSAQSPADADERQGSAPASPPDDGQSEVLKDPSDLRGSVASGIAWNTVLSIAIQGSRLISSLVLVHLLTPADYGLAGMALVVGSFLANFQDLGFGSALIQRKTIDERDRSTIFWTTVGMGALLNLAVIGLAWPIASFFREPAVKNLVIGLSFTLLIGSLGMTQGALLQRAMKYRAIAVRLMIATVGACGASIAVAAAGGGAWALIAYQLVITALVTILLWQLAAWRPRFLYSRASLKRLAGFSSNVVGANFLGFVEGNLDNVLVGRYIGSAALGLYTVSYNVILIPVGRLFAPAGSTLFAAVSRIQDEHQRVSSVWIRAVRAVLAVIFPMIIGLFVVAPDFVQVILGSHWHEATPIIRILGFVTLSRGLSLLADNMLNALGRPNLVFRLTLLNMLLAIGAFVLGLQWGVVGVAACYAAVAIPINLVTVHFVNRMVGVSLWSWLRSISGVTQAVVLMGATCWLCREALLSTELSPSMRLATVVLIGIVTYLAATWWRARDVIQDIRTLVRGRRAAPAAA